MNDAITATYSLEDNKLRIYTEEWLDDDAYKKVKGCGFIWAPKQELFVAPKWTPAREDLCIALAGSIAPEETTLLERAEAKIERLDALTLKKEAQSNAFYNAASRITERFYGGQPILVGHHSEQRARRDQERLHTAMANSVKSAKAIDYWQCRATGVALHAKRNSNPSVRARRIKTLLADLRDRQRDINHANICIALWEDIKTLQDSDPQHYEKQVYHYADGQLKTGAAAPYFRDQSLYQQLEEKIITADQCVEICLDFHYKQANSQYTARWINHILNRLAYERSELADVERFEGTVTGALLQVFARTHGSHKPIAKHQGESWQLSSSVALPLHIGDGQALTLTGSEWKDLMQASGYEVSAVKPKQPPLLNFQATALKGQSWGTIKTFQQVELTKAEYAAIYTDDRMVKLSECGQFRFKVCKHPGQRGYNAEWCAVFLSDARVHQPMESNAIIVGDTEIDD
ncbi:MAG: DUF3560 domain-containing protein [Cellvibrionaceae bacterium]